MDTKILKKNVVINHLKTQRELCDTIVMDDIQQIAQELSDHEVNKLEGKNILITGASGFLPAYMVETLVYFNQSGRLKNKVQIYLLARSHEKLLNRLGHILNDENVHSILQDVNSKLIVKTPFEFIVHAAAPASPTAYKKHPVNSVLANTIALNHLLENHTHLESFLYFSSSEVYGTPEIIPTPENYVGKIDPLGPRSAYAEAKRAGECLCKAYMDEFNLPINIVRPFHIHGPGLTLSDGRIISELIKQGLKTKKLELMSDGLATRTYGYVLDATVYFFKILLKDDHHHCFNVGVDYPETTILSLAQTIFQLLELDGKVKTKTDPHAQTIQGSPSRACPDLTLLHQHFQYRPKTDLENGLKKTIEWLKNEIDYDCFDHE